MQPGSFRPYSQKLPELVSRITRLFWYSTGNSRSRLVMPRILSSGQSPWPYRLQQSSSILHCPLDSHEFTLGFVRSKTTPVLWYNKQTWPHRRVQTRIVSVYLSVIKQQSPTSRTLWCECLPLIKQTALKWNNCGTVCLHWPLPWGFCLPLSTSNPARSTQ